MMPAIQSESFCKFEINENKVPPTKVVEKLQLHCENCGNIWIIPLEKEYQSDREIAKFYKERFENFQDRLNELIKFCDTHYQMNPHKDMLLDKLTKLRNLLYL